MLIVGVLLSSLQSISISSANAAATGWQIQMQVTGKKTALSAGARQTNLGSPGSATFPTITATSTNAGSKTSFASGEGLYSAFFNQTGITKVAFVDGTGNSLDPTTHTNYLVYDLVESTGAESFYAILKRLDEYQRTATAFQNNDTVWGGNSVLNHTAGYSGTLSASGGTGFKTTTSGMTGGVAQIPDRFVVMGINRESDNDIQALAAYWGNLSTTSGKADSWRGQDPFQTFWSYWGNDFHTSSSTQRIGNSTQTAPGVATSATWTGEVYLMAYSYVEDVTPPTFPSSDTFSINENSTSVGTVVSSESATMTISGGEDQAKFSLSRLTDSSTALSFVSAPNFEAPTDVGLNNVYLVVIRAIDGVGLIGYETMTVSVIDIVDTSAFNSFAISGAAVYRSTIQINANVTVPAKVTFKANNVRIPGCINVRTTGTSPNILATCNWKPSRRGSVNLSASATPTGAGISGASATPISTFVTARTGTR